MSRSPWRPGWPQAREQCLRDPIYGPLVRGLAYRMRRGAWGGLPQNTAPSTPAPAPLPHLTFDARRAAANDHDD